MSKPREVHCFNCTTRDQSKLPEKYQEGKGEYIHVWDDKEYNLCPRCKCPEVAYVDASYTPSYGYLNTKKG